MNTAIRRLLGEVCAPVRAPASVCEPFARWRDDPEGFVLHHFGERAWAAQAAAWRELYEHNLLAWRSGRKAGKTRWLSWLVAHFLCTRPSVVLTIGASWDQVRNVLWAGIGELHARARSRGCPLPGEVDATQWRLGPRHFAIGRSTDRPGRIHGFHTGVEMSRDPDDAMSEEELDRMLRASSDAREKAADERVALLVVTDELVPAPILDAVAGSVQGPDAYWALCFNPQLEASSEHLCARVFRDPGPWRRMAVHPHPVEDPMGADVRLDSIPVELQRPSWRAEMARQWGIDSPLYQSQVLGLFSGATSDRQVISESLLIAADEREVYADVGVHVGIDLSRSEGGDECVASRWAWGVKTAEYAWREADAMQSVTIIEALRVRWGEPDPDTGEVRPLDGDQIHVDATGLGGPVVDRLHQRGLYVDGVDFGSSPVGDWVELVGETEFANRRAELHWVLRRALEEGLARIPRRFVESWRQSSWPEYEVRVRSGRSAILISPKDQIKKLHGRSPDTFDADLLAWSRTGAGIGVTRIR